MLVCYGPTIAGVLRCASQRMLLVLALLLVLSSAGCTLVPEVLHEPQFHNPWPQLQKVAVGPFYNLSENPTVAQDEFAHAYYSELSQIFGFEVVPIGVTRRAMLQHGIKGEGEEDFRRLAQLLEVDAIVVGTVNEFTPYYPPRLAMTTRWYAANPCFHPIPTGYGLPWGRAEEEFIPDELVKATEFELAKAQLATQTPISPQTVREVTNHAAATSPADDQQHDEGAQGEVAQASAEVSQDGAPTGVNPPVLSSPASQPEELPLGDITQQEVFSSPRLNAGAITAGESVPSGWPDPSGLIPDPPRAIRPACCPTKGPILSHTRSYNGNDSDFTEALANYYGFQDEARFGGWQAYLQRSEDFIRFCCHLHITEMLAARGGADETKVVYRWSKDR